MSILALLTTILMITINFLANYLPINGYNTGELSDMYPNFFVPAGLTFSIWGLIFFMALVFSIFFIYRTYRLRKRADKRILFYFINSNILNISWVFAWHYLKVGLSLVIMIFLLIMLILLYIESIDYNRRSSSKFIVRGTAGIYLAWIFIAFIANFIVFLTSRGYSINIPWTILLVISSLFITLIFTYFRLDLWFNSVVIWAYIGIVIKRVQTDLSYSFPLVITAISAIVIIIIYSFMRSRKKIKYVH